MKKLTLKLHDLNVRSFHTTPAARGGREGENPTGERNACPQRCTLAFTCTTCEESYRTDGGAYGVVAERRIILYQARASQVPPRPASIRMNGG